MTWWISFAYAWIIEHWPYMPEFVTDPARWLGQ